MAVGAQEKTAAGQQVLGKARAFEVGIAHLCKEGGFRYADLAKRAGQKLMKQAAEKHAAASK